MTELETQLSEELIRTGKQLERWAKYSWCPGMYDKLMGEARQIRTKLSVLGVLGKAGW